MGGIGSAVGNVVGGLTGGLIGGGMGGESESVEQTTNYGIVAGDLVALLPINGGQGYIVLGKLAYAAELSGGTAPASSTSDTLTTAVSLIGGIT